MPSALCPLPTAHRPHYTTLLPAARRPVQARAHLEEVVLLPISPHISPYLPISPVQVHFREQRIEQLAQEKVRVRG